MGVGGVGCGWGGVGEIPGLHPLYETLSIDMLFGSENPEEGNIPGPSTPPAL